MKLLFLICLSIQYSVQSILGVSTINTCYHSEAGDDCKHLIHLNMTVENGQNGGEENV